jgi:hypothetical protein
MARRRKSSGGSGVLAGVLAAVVAVLLWMRFLKTGSRINLNASPLPPPKPGESFTYVDPWGVTKTVRFSGHSS